MARSVEFITAVLDSFGASQSGVAVLRHCAHAAAAAGLVVRQNGTYCGGSDWLSLWGLRHPVHYAARARQLASAGHIAAWDFGYIQPVGDGKDPAISYFRLTVDHDHPWRLFDATPNDPRRFERLGVKLRNDYRADGPVIVVGMGFKSRRVLAVDDWECAQLRKAKTRFPDRQVLYRPKPRKHPTDQHIVWPLAHRGSIDEALRGASLVICRHSNVAVDACIAGIPVECEDGAAFWLYRDNPQPNLAARLDFLHRLAWWQWKCEEMDECWRFLEAIRPRDETKAAA